MANADDKMFRFNYSEILDTRTLIFSNVRKFKHSLHNENVIVQRV